MRPTTTARSKGSFLLARVGQTEAAIAGKLSIAPGQVHGWLTGQRRPQTQNRLKLQELFQIPLLSWDVAYKGKALAQLPAAPPPEPAQPTHPPPAGVDAKPVTVTERVIAVEALIDTLMHSITTDTTSTPAEQAKVLTLLTTSLAQLRRLKGEEIPEARITKQPAWHRLRDQILDSLEKFPEAFRAVLAEIDLSEAADR